MELKERQAENFSEIELLIEKLLDSGICYVDEMSGIIGITEEQL
ncbi:hypothetical protein JOC73_002730 [Alkaliphilus hydrothermalis]|uniref:Uncharacterized protein n=1 Tax=Alkaliphilus hydrothermalis TaxID=1482730 RepID=A0ABS2NT58_9FIRM|nr:hypothetical protein [Alkaliphilus hydrothermalis]